MKRVLLSTTALVAAGLLVTSVAYAGDEEMAEGEMMMEPVSVGISGSARVVLSASSADDSPNMWEHFEPVISGSATMDNGLTFGVSMVIDASGSWAGESDGVMDAYDRTLTVGGAFGDIIVGQTHGARGKMRISSAGATSSFGVQGPYTAGDAGGGVGSDGSGAGMGGRADRIIYMSPSVGGIQLGLSYAPDNSAADDQIAAAATFTQDLGDASVSLNVGYETGSVAAIKAGTRIVFDEMAHGERHLVEEPIPYEPERSPSDLNAGVSISVGDITLSGGMRSSDSGHAMGDGESMLIDVGASMAMGALTVSAGWASHDRPKVGADADRDTNMYALGASYPLGEGVQLDVQVDWGDLDNDNNATTDDEWVQFMIGTAISF